MLTPSSRIEDDDEDADLPEDEQFDDSSLAAPIVLRPAIGQPHDKVLTQHVLRGAFLRKYLHVSNIARKMKETEQQLLRSSALHAGLPSRPGGPDPRSPATPSKPGRQVKSEDEELDTNPMTPLLRRLSSIDKAINKTVKRIRRISAVESGAPVARKQTVSVFAPGSKRKLMSMAPIGESDASVIDNSANDDDDGVDDDDGDDGMLHGVRIDPSSSHMMRVCQHVIAKRAIKAFLRQEMSVIAQIEAMLRDDPSLQRRPLSSVASNRFKSPGGDFTATEGTVMGSSTSHLPIKSMSSDLIEAVTVYLKEGDQHMTVDELYVTALAAEVDKSWKRAIMLASACVVIDSEFILAALLRARCCRRLGLWTQAIKDLSLTVALRPEEYMMVLLRACIYVKMADYDNALADVNRALMLHPKSTDALLLRADIFHRLRMIGQSLQDLTTVLSLDPSCWRAYYDRATIRIRAVEGDEQSLMFHWEHMKYAELLAAIVQDYVNALRKGCTMVEVVETIGDLAIRLLEFSGDKSVLRQVIQNFTHLLQILAHDHRGSFFQHGGKMPTAIAMTVAGINSESPSGPNGARSSSLDRELLIAAIHAQRGRLYVLYNDKARALEDFDHAVVMEYHYPVAHFYRGAFATLVVKDDAIGGASDPVALRANMQHLTRCVALDPTIAGAYTVRGALHLRELKFNSALQDFKAAVATDPTLYEVWLQIALIYLNHYHDSDECVKACSSALTNDSCLARALYLRAEAYTRQGNLNAALRDYGRLTVAQPNDRWAQLLRGRLLLLLQLPRPALYSFILFMDQGGATNLSTTADEAREAAASKTAHVLCGRAYKILSRFKEAVYEFQRAAAINPTSDNLVLLSESLHSMGDTENSLRVSEKVISADPGSFKGYVRRAQLLVSTQQFSQAMAEYDKALFLAPKEGRVYYERGIVQLQLYLRWRRAFQLNFEKKSDAAKKNGVSMVSPSSQSQQHRSSPFFDPRTTAIDVEAALGAEAMNDEPLVRKMMKQFFAGSLADLTKCIRLEPTMAEPYIDRAELFALGDDFDRAFRDFASAIERNPKCSRAHLNLGVLKCQFSAFASAISDFDMAAKCDPQLALALFNRGVAYQKLSLWKQAEKSYDRCISLWGRGRHIDAHRNRAMTRCQLGDYTGALADFNEVRESAPDDDQLHGGLGFVLLQLGRYEMAAKSFATYGRLSRDTFADSGNAYFNLGSASDAGRIDKAKHADCLKTALRFYLRAARIHPSSLDLRLNIANCLRKLGELERAVSQCDAIRIAQPLHHASFEGKALALFQMPGRLEDAVGCMNDAIRACIASSSSLENIFFAFSSTTIHRNALERKTVRISRGGTGVDDSKNSNGNGSKQSPRRSGRNDSSGSRQRDKKQSSETHETASTPATTVVASMDQLMKKMSDSGASAASSPPLSASEIIVNGSHKQILSLYMTNRGILLERLGRFDEARLNYNDAIYFDVLSVPAFVSLGTLNIIQNNYTDAITALKRALTIDPSAGVAHLNLGIAYLCQHQLDDALAAFDAAITILPSCSYAFANKAVALAMRGNMPEAEHNFKRAIEELPSRKEYYLARGKIIAQQKRLQDAMVDFSTALYLGYEGKL